MADILTLIHEKVEKIAEDVAELKVSSGRQEEIQNQHESTLQDHMKRSDTLEKLYAHLDENKIQPLQQEMSQIHGVVKFIGFLGILASIIVAILKIVGK